MSNVTSVRATPSAAFSKTQECISRQKDALLYAAEDNRGVELPELREKAAERSKKMQLVTLQNDLVPEELLATLTSTVCTSDKLGHRHHKHSTVPRDFKACGIRRPDAVWHHPLGRRKYRYFLDQPTSLTGAGRDISFLCDAMAAQRKRMSLPPMGYKTSDTTTQCIQKDMNLMDSLIPKEYHILKNKGVQGLDFYEDKFTVQLQDNEQKLRIFPSLKPSGRLEAVQLMRVMDDMLDKAGINQQSEKLTELSQMERLLELVRMEQNIYNIVFHELIRQVSVECAERGQLLAKLREHYVSLLDHIPRQLMGLHTETLAQRALDRRLTEEIACFQDSIQQLNIGLGKMREHDEYVSNQAESARQELANALEQSQKNSDMVQEFHELYEMQRRRLENQVVRLTEERDLWSKVTYSLALKVISLNKLQLANKLHVSEQTWSKTAEHLTLLLTSKDTEDLNLIMQLTDQWKEQLTTFMEQLRKAEHTQCEEIRAIEQGITKWHTLCSTQNKCPDPKYEKVSEKEIYADLKQWANTLTVQCERYGGEELLSFQECLSVLGSLQESWVEVCLQLFRRHPAPDGEPPKGQEAMREVGRAVSELHKQLDTRVNGESGIHKQIVSLIRTMESWATKLRTAIGRSESMLISDWLKLEKTLSGWQSTAEEALQNVTSTQLESEKVKNKPHINIEVEDVFETVREFITTQSNFFECENRRLCEEVSSIHTALTRWMVDLLLLMVPDHSDDQEAAPLQGPRAYSVLTEVSLEKLEVDGRTLAQKLDFFSKYITSSCQLIVEEEIQKSMSQDVTDSELYERNKLQRECSEWLDTCRTLLSDVKGSPVELHVTTSPLPTAIADTVISPADSLESLMCALQVNLEVPPETGEGGETRDESPLSPAALPEVSHANSKVEWSGHEEEPEAASIMKLIGHDGNIIERTLGDCTVLLDGTEEVVLRPITDNAHKAFDALATVRMLQKELHAVEVRAQGAEERALRAEEALQASLVKIQDLERQLQGRPSLEPKVHKKMPDPPAPPPAPATAASKKATPEPKPSSTPKKLKKR